MTANNAKASRLSCFAAWFRHQNILISALIVAAAAEICGITVSPISAHAFMNLLAFTVGALSPDG